MTVLYIINNNQMLNQQARVTVTSTGLQLWRMASGVAFTETLLTYASYPTLDAMMAAINALGNGWTAWGDQGDPDYGLWPSADLWVPPSYGDGVTSQGALTARGQNCELKMHTYELAGYQWDAGRGWLLRAIPYTDPELLQPEDLVWPTGINNIRVQYTAGYTTIPEAVVQACVEWVADMYWYASRDPTLATTVGSSGTASSYRQFMMPLLYQPPQRCLPFLAPYRRFSSGTNQG